MPGVEDSPDTQNVPEIQAATTAPEAPPEPTEGGFTQPEPKSEYSPEELAQAEADLKELEEFRKAKGQQQPGFDPNAIGQSIAQSLQPFLPKPPAPTKLYETDKFLESRETLVEGVKLLVKEALEEFRGAIDPRFGELDQIKSVIPELYFRAAENPNYQKARGLASELTNKYNIPWASALRMAQDQVQKEVQTSVQAQARPSIPKYASSPDTRANSMPPDPLAKGPADFADIVSTLRKVHGNNI